MEHIHLLIDNYRIDIFDDDNLVQLGVGGGGVLHFNDIIATLTCKILTTTLSDKYVYNLIRFVFHISN